MAFANYRETHKASEADRAGTCYARETRASLAQAVRSAESIPIFGHRSCWRSSSRLHNAPRTPWHLTVLMAESRAEPLTGRSQGPAGRIREPSRTQARQHPGSAQPGRQSATRHRPRRLAPFSRQELQELQVPPRPSTPGLVRGRPPPLGGANEKGLFHVKQALLGVAVLVLGTRCQNFHDPVQVLHAGELNAHATLPSAEGDLDVRI